MLSLTEKEIDLISTQLLKGMICFYQIDKKRIHQMPDDEDYYNYDLTEAEEDVLDEIEESPDNYAEFTQMEPAQEHQMMQDFIDKRIKEKNLAEELVSSLTKPKANTAFKFLIEDSKYKKDWVEFRKEKYYDWIKEQVDSFNFTDE